MAELREDLIESAVIFLKDEKVASAPLNKKIEFLEEKKLTHEEIQEALRRANDSSASTSTTSNSPSPRSAHVTSPVVAAPPPLPAYSHLSYAVPPQPPKRDWKDYFIMATVSVGVTYGLYQVAKRYILPSILPPTPAALESDKEALDAEFAKAQEILDQLQKDQDEIKKNELERTKKIENLVSEVQSTIEQVKAKVFQRDEDLKLIKTQIELVKETVPKSLTLHNTTQQQGLEDVYAELKLLKQLVTSRLQGGSAPAPAAPATSTTPPKIVGAAATNATSTTPPSIPTPNTSNLPSANGTSASVPVAAASADDTTASSSSSVTSVPVRAGIPAWQLAASKSSD
ncbi:hypothetical protein DV451_003402 [Geotrichum candidum]|uniref:Peroxisomal membrane protein PEX14 n=1 Tax=Geotrichum candidum TaxID=1173061 RepID=A0A9P5G3V9_GEOCN|nr:hypothetical protein DV451_003402 [Geotrichum candidum]KAF5129329.1 hypothetical protein DV495_002363 [Geotrichum candidum]KAI8133408.1 hypothetical protein DUD61_002947 [Geotrichum candidum]KAI9213485.1 hypothetical protein DS838_001658 [Geotrichum bryndzae]